MDSAQNASSAAGTGGSGGNGSVINDTSVSTTVDDSKQNLNQVINSIQKTLGILHQLNLTVSNFNAAYQLPLLQRLLIDDGKNPDEFTRDVLNSCIAKNQSTKGKTDAFKGLRKHLLEELEQTFPDEVESYREIRAASAARLLYNQCLISSVQWGPQDPSVKSFPVFKQVGLSISHHGLVGPSEAKRIAQAQSMLPNGDMKVKMEV
uniref:Mediator of RNA polymerase II transcription subunit 10 n=1 Tax=Cucumis melo TaxID=3656 RepID=A0A9I9D6Z9_CUCME